MSSLNFSTVEVLYLSQVGGYKTGLGGLLWLSQVSGVWIGVCLILFNYRVGMLQEPLNMDGSTIFLEQLVHGSTFIFLSAR